MNRTQFNKAVVPGLFSLAVETYRPRSGQTEDWKKVCHSVRGSNRAYEESAYFAGLGNVALKGEGAPISYDEMVQGPTKRWNHKTYGLGVSIAEELIEDSLYPDLPTEMTSLFKELGASAKETQTLLVFDIFNSGTGTSTHTSGDGVAIFSASHTQLRGGTWSNLLAPASDLSATALQTAIDNFENLRDDTGKIQMIKATKMIVNPSNAWKAKELLNSTYDPESPNNSINTLKDRNLELVVTPHYTDTDAFTLWAEAPNEDSGLIAFQRRKPKFASDGDFETGDMKGKVTFRFSVEINRATPLFHSAGA